MVEEPLEIRVERHTARGHHAHPGLRRRTGAGFLLDRGHHRRPRGHRVDPLLQQRRRRRRNTYNVLDVDLAPGVSCPTPASNATSTPPPRAGCAARPRWTRSGNARRTHRPTDTVRVAGRDDRGAARPAAGRAEGVRDHRRPARGRLVHRGRRTARDPGGRRAAQRRRQADRLGRSSRTGFRCAGASCWSVRSGVVRAGAEGGDGRDPDARRGVRAVVAGRSTLPTTPA